MGIPGLFAAALIDSAAAPLAGGLDAAVFLHTAARPAMVYLIVLSASMGSMLGALILHGIALKGGKKILARFKAEKIAWAEKKLKEHGIWTVMAGMLAPPPLPTKVIVLAAGFLRMNRLQLCMAVFLGRLVRYSLLGSLVVIFGQHAALILRDHCLGILLVLVGPVALLTFTCRLTQRISAAKIEEPTEQLRLTKPAQVPFATVRAIASLPLTQGAGKIGDFGGCQRQLPKQAVE